MKKSIEWISGKTRIVCKQDDNSIQINLYPNYPKDHCIVLKASFVEGCFTFDDLTGNGSNSGHQEQGWGKLIVNTAIQLLGKAHREKYGSIPPNEIQVQGETSNEGDPKSEPESSACRNRRNRFWESFGLSIQNEEAFHSKIYTTQANLKYNKRGRTANNDPTYIDLKYFWKLDERPALIEADVDYLNTINLDLLNEDSIPKKETYETLERKAKWQQDLLDKSCFSLGVVIILLVASAVGLSLNTVTATILGIIAWRYLCFSLFARIGQNFSSTKKARLQRDYRNSKIKEMNDAIEDIENEINGFIWRIHPYLRRFEGFRSEEYDELAKLSRAGDDISSYREAYSRYLKKARQTLCN